jgi:hypothetical protein
MRKAYLALLALLALICAASSALAVVSNTGTTSFSALVGGSISVTVDDASLDFGTITTGATETESNTINVVCNIPAGYSLTVISNDAEGKMFDSATSQKLTDPVVVTVGEVDGVAVTSLEALSVDDGGIKNNPAGTNYGGSYVQRGADTDPAGSFALTLTYTATAL